MTDNNRTLITIQVQEGYSTEPLLLERFSTMEDTRYVSDEIICMTEEYLPCGTINEIVLVKDKYIQIYTNKGIGMQIDIVGGASLSTVYDDLRSRYDSTIRYLANPADLEE